MEQGGVGRARSETALMHPSKRSSLRSARSRSVPAKSRNHILKRMSRGFVENWQITKEPLSCIGFLLGEDPKTLQVFLEFLLGFVGVNQPHPPLNDGFQLSTQVLKLSLIGLAASISLVANAFTSSFSLEA